MVEEKGIRKEIMSERGILTLSDVALTSREHLLCRYSGIVVNVLSHKQIYFFTRDDVLFSHYFTTFQYLYCKWSFSPRILRKNPRRVGIPIPFQLVLMNQLHDLSFLIQFSAEMQHCPSFLYHFSRSGAKLKG